MGGRAAGKTAIILFPAFDYAALAADKDGQPVLALDQEWVDAEVKQDGTPNARILGETG